MITVYGRELFTAPYLLENSSQEQLQQYCSATLEKTETVNMYLNLFTIIVTFNGVGFFTSFLQRIVTQHVRYNVELSYFKLSLEFSLALTSIFNLIISKDTNLNNLISRKCSTVMELTAE